MSEGAKTKGVGIASVRAFCVERFGEGGWQGVVAKLPVSDRRELDEVLPLGWYSLALHARLLRALDDVHGYGDLALVVQLGRFEAERNTATVQREFLRLGGAAKALEKFAESWSRYHDSGRWELLSESETRVLGYLDGWGYVDNALCRELVGYLGRCLELIGAPCVIVEHPFCRAKGDPRCTFRARWGALRRAPGGALESGSHPIVRVEIVTPKGTSQGGGKR